MKILITGGSGMVGHALQRFVQGQVKSQLQDYKKIASHSYIYVSSKDVDLRNYLDTLEYFKKIKPDAVIHLAANVGGLYKNMNQNLAMFEDNMAINMNVVKCSRIVGIKRGIACLSTCVYPDNIIDYPIKEDEFHLGPPHPSNEGYAYAKRMLEVQCRLSNESIGNLIWTCVIPTNLYGPHDNFDLQTSHVVPALIQKCIEAKQNCNKFVVFGTGFPLRQFLFVDDFADILLWLITKNTVNVNTINVTPDIEDEISIGRLAHIIAKQVGVSNDDIQFDTSKSDGQIKKTASNATLRALIPMDFQFTSLENGVASTLNWLSPNARQNH